MRLLSLFMIVGYFEIYEVLMFYHGEKLWLYSGLTAASGKGDMDRW